MSYDLVEKSMEEETLEEFDRRAREQAEFLKQEIRADNLDNSDFTVGLEIELYGVDEEDRLARLDGSLFEVDDQLNKELGLHNAELNSRPDVLGDSGLLSQEDQITEILERANEEIGEEGQQLVLDAMWTVPPEEGSVSYLSSTENVDDLDVAENMRENRRYYAIDSYYVDLVDEVEIDVPGVHRSFPTILSESLATSIQPHLQVPVAEEMPAYYNTAIRTMAPILALSTNSPFMPPDLYTGEIDPRDTHHELRIWVFEQSVNVEGEEKVKFPDDIDATEEVVERVLEDRTYSPFLREWTEDGEKVGEESYTDGFWEFEFKRGTFWRWLRTVIGGEPISEDNDERSIRIEYRPLPTQPTVHDNVALLAFTAGAVTGLVSADHPVTEVPWSDTKRSFYDVVRNGFDADLVWRNADGEETTDVDEIYGELFHHARKGLQRHGVAEETVERYLEPLRTRWRGRTSPSEWKIQQVEDRMEEGTSFEDAVHEMQREYIRRSGGDGCFADWFTS